jgi:hypothetical protein
MGLWWAVAVRRAVPLRALRGCKSDPPGGREAPLQQSEPGGDSEADDSPRQRECERGDLNPKRRLK